MTNKEAAEILTEIQNTPCITWTNGADIALDRAIKALEDVRPTDDIQTAVWELYKRHQPHLATHVYEFGAELRELLGSTFYYKIKQEETNNG